MAELNNQQASGDTFDIQIKQLRNLVNTIDTRCQNNAQVSTIDQDQIQLQLASARSALEQSYQLLCRAAQIPLLPTHSKRLKIEENKGIGSSSGLPYNHKRHSFEKTTDEGMPFSLLCQRVVESSPQGIIVTIDGMIAYANRASFTLLGFFKAGPLLNTAIEELLHPSSLNSFRQQQQAAQQGESTSRFVGKFQGGNGATRKLELGIQAIPMGQKMASLLTFHEASGKQPAKHAIDSMQEPLDYLLTQSPAMLYSASPFSPYGVTYISQNVEVITGYKPSEFTHNPAFWVEHIHPDDLAYVQENFPVLFRQGAYQLEYRFRFFDGAYHWLYDHCRLTYDEKGEVKGIVGCMSDCTAKKNAEVKADLLLKETQWMNQKLQVSERALTDSLSKVLELNEQLIASERLANQVISSIEKGICVFDTELRCVVWNTFLEKSSGLAAHQVKGKRPEEFFPFMKEMGFLGMLEKALAGETIFFPDTWIPGKASKSVCINGCYSPLRNSLSQIIGVVSTINIVTERKLSEQALVTQKNLLQAFYDTAPFHMCVYEQTSRGYVYKLPNQYMARFLGIPVEELTGKTVRDLGLPDNLVAYWDELFTTCLERGQPVQVEHTFPNYAGVPIAHLGVFSPIKGTQSIAFISLNIAERKAIEEEKSALLQHTQALNEELKASQKKLKEAQKIARLGSWEFDVLTGKIEWSEEVFHICGLDPSKGAPHLDDFLQLIALEFVQLVNQVTTDALSLGKEFEIEIKILPADTAFRWIINTGRPVFNEAGEVIRLFGVIYDLTERKIAEEKIQSLLDLSQQTNARLLASEEELRRSLEHTLELNKQIVESEQRWQFALEGSGDGVWDWNPETNQVFYSKRARELLAIGEEQEFSELSHWASRLHLDDKENIFEKINKCLTGETEFYQAEYRALGRGNSYYWFLARGKVVTKNEKGQVIRMIGTMSDIDQRKHMEETLRQQNQDLKKINAELDSFVYRTSHDLRSPLASVLGLINISREERDENQKAVYLDLMEKSIRKLDAFISDIITYSRNARIDVVCKPIDLRTLVEGTLEELKFMEGFDTIEKIIEVEQSMPFLSDPFRLGIIFNNMLSNAIKYRSTLVERSFISISIQVDVEQARVEFSDNGKGIAEENIDKIFNMFFRASTDSKGSGLGLYIVKEVIQTLQGKITVQSKVGKGTCFTVVIPNNQLQPKIPSLVT
jgi:PAS domain S-box-containing protein